MTDQAKLQTMKRLKQELMDLQNNPVLTLGVTADKVNNDIFHWKVTMFGPQDSPYAGGVFYLTIDFPDNYPQKKPEVKFTTKIYHCNVGSSGHVCINTLNDWEANIKKGQNPPCIAEVLGNIFALFNAQNPDSAYNYADEYRNNRAKFEANAREWTRKYAGY